MSATIPAGLRGQAVGSTAVSSLGDGDALLYRGYAIEDLAAGSSFEEVAYLLLRGRLPTAAELDAYRARLVGLRPLPVPLLDLFELIPDEDGLSSLMDVLRTACSFLGSLEPEPQFTSEFDAPDRLIARIPGIMAYWHRFRADGERIDTFTDDPSTAGHLLRLLFDREPAEEQRRALDVSLMLYADLAFNASTFACRICAATLSDIYSCITTGIATLRGPLHGGASALVHAQLAPLRTAQEARDSARALLARRERIIGFGHAIYRVDPRSAILKAWAQRLAEASGRRDLFEVAEAVEKVMLEEKKMSPNVDFYTALCYRLLEIPPSLYSPLFVAARVAGWCAHVAEQRADNKLIHPLAAYHGPARRAYPPIAERPAAE